MEGGYETHSPTRTLPSSSAEEELARIREHEARLDRLYGELAANETEYADLRHRIRVEEAHLERRRYGLLVRAGLAGPGDGG